MYRITWGVFDTLTCEMVETFVEVVTCTIGDLVKRQINPRRPQETTGTGTAPCYYETVDADPHAGDCCLNVASFPGDIPYYVRKQTFNTVTCEVTEDTCEVIPYCGGCCPERDEPLPDGSTPPAVLYATLDMTYNLSDPATNGFCFCLAGTVVPLNYIGSHVVGNGGPLCDHVWHGSARSLGECPASEGTAPKSLYITVGYISKTAQEDPDSAGSCQWYAVFTCDDDDPYGYATGPPRGSVFQYGPVFGPPLDFYETCDPFLMVMWLELFTYGNYGYTCCPWGPIGPPSGTDNVIYITISE